ncbi:MAG: J domain-containing protein [Granulosicoccus sp.]
MSQPVDYYKLLHVQRDAPEAVIKASYRAMMQKMQYHPDLGGDEDLAKQLNLAVGVLCNEAQRTSYDRILAASQEAQPPPGAEASPQDDKAGMDNPEARNPPPYAAKAHPSLPIKPGCDFCHCTRSDTPLDGPYNAAKSGACQVCGAAATPIHSINDSDTAELRRLHRQAYTMSAEYWQRWPQPVPATGKIINFSTIGCALESTEQLAPGHILKLEAQLFKAVCRVCDCRAGVRGDTFILGLAFINLNLYTKPGSLLNTAV